jgi:hypothetical protein
MNPTLLDIAILFSFVPVWAGLCWAYESWTDPRNRRKRQRNARYKKRMKELNRQGRLMR